ncbi:MAG: winged helix-turn-helix domain-containing protein, partial [Holophagales bacterium]|nr:winged helix-turn-helix domain-containing protein [Holophagales bacterium]
MARDEPILYRFAGFELDAETSILRRDDRIVPLQPQPTRLLLLLVSRPGEVLQREDIRQSLWGDGAFVAHEQGINFAVRKLRAALGDNAEAPRFVETLRSVGYRFLPPVERAPRPAPGKPAETLPPPVAGGPSSP